MVGGRGWPGENERRLVTMNESDYAHIDRVKDKKLYKSTRS